MTRRVHQLLVDKRGTATIEFALLSVFLFITLSAALDIGIWYQQRLRIDSAVEQGAMLAFNSRTSVDQNAVGTYVAAAAQLSTAPTVTVGCNGGTSNCVNSSRTCACLSGSAPTPTFTTAASCNASCPDGSLSGYYMTIQASAPTKTIIVSSAKLSTFTQNRSAVIRLQ